MSIGRVVHSNIYMNAVVCSAFRSDVVQHLNTCKVNDIQCEFTQKLGAKRRGVATARKVLQMFPGMNSPGGVTGGCQDLGVAKETAAGQVTWEGNPHLSPTEIQFMSCCTLIGAVTPGVTVRVMKFPAHLCVRPAP